MRKLKKVWTKFLESINGLSLLVTLFLIPISLGGIIYYLLIDYDFKRVILNCIVLWVAIDSNKKL